MIAREFHLYAIVEGYGEIEAVPKLLHRIWNDDGAAPMLRIDKKPHRVPKGVFMSNARKRREALTLAGKRMRAKDGGVLVLMDADSDCCKEFVHNKKAAEIRADIAEILRNVPCVFAAAEKGYESWLVAGFGGSGKVGDPKGWLKDLTGQYQEIPDQAKLTSAPEFDINLACRVNASFRRFREKVLKMTAA